MPQVAKSIFFVETIPSNASSGVIWRVYQENLVAHCHSVVDLFEHCYSVDEQFEYHALVDVKVHDKVLNAAALVLLVPLEATAKGCETTIVAVVVVAVVAAGAIVVDDSTALAGLAVYLVGVIYYCLVAIDGVALFVH